MKVVMKKQNKKGFTIIEVVMVLAIGGLIFAVVLAAFPRVQKARRDGQRKNDLSALAGELEFFQSSNRGRYPSDQTEITALITSMGSDFTDPSSKTLYSATTTYTIDTTAATPGSITYSDGAECSADSTYIDNSGFNRTYALVIKLEEGHYCIDL